MPRNIPLDARPFTRQPVPGCGGLVVRPGASSGRRCGSPQRLYCHRMKARLLADLQKLSDAKLTAEHDELVKAVGGVGVGADRYQNRA